jgi:hypothetical protein
MKEIHISIEELASMNYTDRCECIRQRIVDMYARIGDCQGAVIWLWKDLAARERGDK